MMHFLLFFLFADHCDILELGYLKFRKIVYPELGQVPDIPDKCSTAQGKLICVSVH
jgi:hypothetical protein